MTNSEESDFGSYCVILTCQCAMLETSRGSLTTGGMECKSEMQSLSCVNLHERGLTKFISPSRLLLSDDQACLSDWFCILENPNPGQYK